MIEAKECIVSTLRTSTIDNQRRPNLMFTIVYVPLPSKQATHIDSNLGFQFQNLSHDFGENHNSHFAHDTVASSSQQHLPNAQDFTTSWRQDTMEVVKTNICGDCLGRGANVRWAFVLVLLVVGRAKQLRGGNWSCSGLVLREGTRLRVGLTDSQGWECGG